MTEKETKADRSSYDLLALMRKRFREGVESDRHNRDAGREDMEFAYVPGAQWDKDRKEQYEKEERPCLEINRMPTFIGQVKGAQRQGRPAVKVHPVDSRSDPETAEVIEGLCRHIEADSQADVAYDTAFEHCISAGFGYWRVVTDYAEDGSFDNQDIRVEAIVNNFSVVFDPLSTRWDKTDAEWVIVHSLISRDTYDRLYKGKLPADVDIPDGTYEQWVVGETVRLAEYFFKEYVTKKIYLLETGEVVDELQEGDVVKDIRTINTYEIRRIKVDGFNILEKEQVWPSKYWPIVPVEGESIGIDGKKYTRGLIRYGKDPQRAYNFSRSREIEVFALAPLAPIVATATQIGIYKEVWDTAHKRTYPYLPFVADPAQPGAPQRLMPPPLSTAISHSTAQAVDEMKATIGLFDASLGSRSNEISGVAIQARQREGDTGTYPYIDNLVRARILTYKIFIDLIPKIYDTRRVVRILGIDGSGRMETINEPGIVKNEEGMPIAKVLRDLTVGKYDVTVTLGPSFSTQRMEAAQSMTSFIQVAPQTAPLIGDLLAKSLDWPGAQEVANRLKSLVPPGALSEDELQEMQQKQAKMQQMQPQAPPPPPDPRMIEMQIKAQADGVRLTMEKEKHEIELMKLMAEVEKIRSEGLKNVALAEAAEAGTQIQLYQQSLDTLAQRVGAQVEEVLKRVGGNGWGGTPPQGQGPPSGGGMPPGQEGIGGPPPEMMEPIQGITGE